MKKKIITLFIMFIATFSIFNLSVHNTAKAEVTVSASQIGFSQYPTKTTYSTGESLDLTGMVVISLNSDGTSTTLTETDYTVEGYNSSQIGIQTITIRYQNCIANLIITVLPAKIKNISVVNSSMTGYTLTWEAFTDINYYEIYVLDDLTGTYSFFATTASNTYTFNSAAGNIRNYQIRAVKDDNGVIYTGVFSDTYSAATAPGKVESLTVINTTDTSVQLSWSAVIGATGYNIYRLDPSTTNYRYSGNTVSTTFIDTEPNSGTAYQYKVCAYTLNTSFQGEFSPIVDTSTNPAKVVVKFKAGDQKVRLTWSKVTGANSYDIYVGDDISGYGLLTTYVGNGNCTYTVEDLITDETYSFYVIAHRVYNGVAYDSTMSDPQVVTIKEIEDTNTTAKYFANKTEFKNSTAYTKIPLFKNLVNYSKSYVIPGLITTNVAGFSSSTMCPQGITFAEDYLLLTAYDLSAQENSVIYVMDKDTKELKATLILPTKTHLGGICFDGTNVWVTTGTKVSAILFSDIEDAVGEGASYSFISFRAICKVGISASYITYYHDKLWVGSYNELNTTNMYSFSIDDFDTSVALTKVDSIKMPTRVQGIAFTEDGYLILSRSCQLYKGLRGYMHRIDVYQPDLAYEDSGIIPIGKLLNYVYTPSMNENIALSGEYLYVNFESGAFENASYKMDRVCALNLSAIINKNSEQSVTVKK
jgi:fibronectin type 3 domain-containing protein